MKRINLFFVFLLLCIGIVLTGCDGLMKLMNTAPTVTITEADQTIDNGASLTLHAVASDADGDELSYQWYVDDAKQIGAISTDYEFSAVPSTEISYVLKVEVSDGIDCSEDSVTITVSAPVEHNRLKRWTDWLIQQKSGK